MTLLTIILALVAIGVVLWLINKIPMDATVKIILHIFVVIVVVIWLMKVSGLWKYLSEIKI